MRVRRGRRLAGGRLGRRRKTYLGLEKRGRGGEEQVEERVRSEGGLALVVQMPIYP